MAGKHSKKRSRKCSRRKDDTVQNASSSAATSQLASSPPINTNTTANTTTTANANTTHNNANTSTTPSSSARRISIPFDQLEHVANSIPLDQLERVANSVQITSDPSMPGRFNITPGPGEELPEGVVPALVANWMLEEMRQAKSPTDEEGSKDAMSSETGGGVSGWPKPTGWSATPSVSATTATITINCISPTWNVGTGEASCTGNQKVEKGKEKEKENGKEPGKIWMDPEDVTQEYLRRLDREKGEGTSKMGWEASLVAKKDVAGAAGSENGEGGDWDEDNEDEEDDSEGDDNEDEGGETGNDNDDDDEDDEEEDDDDRNEEDGGNNSDSGPLNSQKLLWWVRRGIKALDRKEYTNAERLFRYAHSLGPTTITFYYLADTFFEQGKYQHTLDMLQLAWRWIPKPRRAHKWSKERRARYAARKEEFRIDLSMLYANTMVLAVRAGIVCLHDREGRLLGGIGSRDDEGGNENDGEVEAGDEEYENTEDTSLSAYHSPASQHQRTFSPEVPLSVSHPLVRLPSNLPAGQGDPVQEGSAYLDDGSVVGHDSGFSVEERGRQTPSASPSSFHPSPLSQPRDSYSLVSSGSISPLSPSSVIEQGRFDLDEDVGRNVDALNEHATHDPQMGVLDVNSTPLEHTFIFQGNENANGRTPRATVSLPLPSTLVSKPFSPFDPLTPTEVAAFELDMRRIGNIHPEQQSLQYAWMSWRDVKQRCENHTAEECKDVKDRAKKRLREMGVYKSLLTPVLKYDPFDYEDIRSLLSAVGTPPVLPLDLSLLQNKLLAELSFLFGGSGDGRHAFGTLIDLHKNHFPSLSSEQKAILKVHMTLLDVHPATLARVLVVLYLVHLIEECNAGKKTTMLKTQPTLFELQLTLFYMYTSLAMPSYCHHYLHSIIRSLIRLLSPPPASGSKASKLRPIPALPSYIHVDVTTLPAILDVLRYWTNQLGKSLKRLLLLHSKNRYRPRQPEVLYEPMFLSKEDDPHRKQRSGAQRRYKQKDSPSPVVESNLGGFLPSTASPNRELDGMRYEERGVYRQLLVVLPPTKLLSRHPKFDDITKKKPTAIREVEKAFMKAKTHVHKDWKCNPTVFDNSYTKYPGISSLKGYPHISLDPFEVSYGMGQFNARVQDTALCPPGRLPTASENTIHFFGLLGAAIKAMGDKLIIELIQEELTVGLTRIVEDEHGPRPTSFPKEWTRMWLGSVPDRTNGILNILAFMMPYLQPIPKSIISFNSEFSRELIAGGHYFSLFNLFTRERMIYLGCKLITTQSRDDMTIQALPLSPIVRSPYFASAESTYDFLVSIFLAIIRPDLAHGPSTELCLTSPNNLAAFFRLVIWLQEIGLPAHWLSVFVQDIARANLTITKPLDTLLYQEVTGNKFSIFVWYADIQATLLAILPALPFEIEMLPDSPVLEDICIYRVNTAIAIDNSDEPPFCKTVCLLLYRCTTVKPEKTVATEDFFRDYKKRMSSCSIQVMLSTEGVDIPNGMVSWRMARQWYEMMKAQEWSMVALRTDTGSNVTKPVASSNWIEAKI
ncbi:hypothetical protein BDQ12DRAFT_684969 [Crucibulum laeve]|uniref:DUF4470 domain-containing protein n=1 Tax=Crucibulum laeve TaxID=68775 RepID=A0A5C3LYG7_9AGAR|nr:hypothetical protein BDQ12DRAFT_684969 [Crucibulum laeve]